MSKVDGAGGGGDWSPLKSSCNYFLLEASRDNEGEANGDGVGGGVGKRNGISSQ